MRKLVFLICFLCGMTVLQAQDYVGSASNGQTTETNASAIKSPSGYQGFCDQQTLYRVMEDGSSTVGFSTTHGFYFNGHTFIGVGIGVEGGNDFFAVPVYSSLKYIFSNKKPVSPTVQLRIGSYFSEDPGAYADLSLGVRFASKRDFAVNVMLVGTFFEMQKITDTYYEWDDVNHVSRYVEQEKKIYPSGVGLRIGIEW